VGVAQAVCSCISAAQQAANPVIIVLEANRNKASAFIRGCKVLAVDNNPSIRFVIESSRLFIKVLRQADAMSFAEPK
jgi:hypothetical protein